MIGLQQSKGFKEIVFGKAAAENEKTPRFKKLLLQGFLDAYDYTNQLLNGEKFLVLGLKGSGKSAFGARLELLSAERPNLIVKNYYISEKFPHQMFSDLMESQEPKIIKFQYNWEYLILLVLLESFAEDDSIEYKDLYTYKELIGTLKALGLIPSNSFADLIIKIKGETFKANLSKVLDNDAKESKTKLEYIFNLLREVCYNISVKKKHLLIIDGIDDILTKQIRQKNIISALIETADRMNRHFLDKEIDSKILIMCRTDLFKTLPGSNLNKIKLDSGIMLNWYDEGALLDSSNLVRLINLRAEVALGYKVDVFEEFLPRTILRGNRTMKTLLDYTRYRPRDFIQLFNSIQANTTSTKPTKEEIWSGIKQYSINYFMDEIKNDLDGFLNDDEREKAMKLLAMMNKSKFSIEDIEKKKTQDSRFRSLDLVKVLQELFDCGAISNYWVDDSGREINTTKYRNPTAPFDPSKNIRIHWGLWKALNITDVHDESD